MPLRTVVEDYLLAGVKTAEFERLEDDTVGATIPACPGVIAMGADARACLLDLYTRLEDWVRVRLAHGERLPVFANIDLNGDQGHALAAYHSAGSPQHPTEFFEGTEQLEA